MIGKRQAAKRDTSRHWRRTQPAEVRVDDLMSAAAALFVAKGIETTTIDEIVARAGVAKGTFYHYFSTKVDVIIALRACFTQDFLSRVAAAINERAADDHAGRLSAWLRGAVGTYLANVELHDVVFHDFPHHQRQSQEKDDVIAQIVAVLEDGRKAGVWTFPDARSAALIVFDGMHAVADDAIIAGTRDPEPPCRLLEEMFTRMLAVPRPRS
ncbi:TetR/AcrR family transcriptional regulator [Bradyrhizobium sp. CER78]|uniref:TetR/AcrR family transcriptional regulator n=1 Tax=Bradyrhizobium sp. CER78 TaxID=3039162 RepID=UPI00244C3CFF|nr:TetR/AcrR family transcriptional regulator [Bradyrhizobium sp. CER78]MDH2385105.1 TetR/AcrR family transcriptional regulator [Bradyrhizobium sp. CER78]